MVLLSYDTGVVVKTTADSGEVFVVVDNVCRLFSFSRGMFYILGKRCVLDMTEALEFGMNVNVCYKFSSGGQPFLAAVSLGDMPDSIRGTESVYHQRGIVCYVTVEHLVRNEDNDSSRAFISKDVVYPFGVELAVSKGDRLFYDAYMNNESNAYEGTCAWFEGKEPTVYMFFRYAENVIQTDEMGLISGVVCVFPNDDAAIVDVETSSGSIKVLLLRKNFERDISVGDMLCMRLDYGVVGGCSVWYAIEAWKDGVEITPLKENIERVYDAETDEKVDAETGEKVDKTHEKVDAETETTIDVEAVMAKVGESPFGVLYGEPPLKGFLQRLSTQSCLSFIYYEGTKIYVDRRNVYASGEVCAKHIFYQMVSARVTVSFEAVISSRFDSSLDITRDATCVWVGDKPSFTDIVSQMPRSKMYLLKEKNRFFEGMVIKLCLPDVALIDLYQERSLACLPVTAFGHEKGQWISHFVGLYDRVTFTLGTLPEYPKMLCAFNVDFCYQGMMSGM